MSSATVNLCLAMEPTEGAYAEDWNRVLQAAMLKVNDRVARATLGLVAPQTRAYDLDRRDASLPTVPCLVSSRERAGRGGRCIERGALTGVGAAR